jgi:hypothetical protein
MTTAPARFMRATTSASRARVARSIARVPPLSGMPATSIRSFTATGAPPRKPLAGDGSDSGSQVNALSPAWDRAAASATSASPAAGGEADSPSAGRAGATRGTYAPQDGTGSRGEEIELGAIHLDAPLPGRGALAVAMAEPAGEPGERVLRLRHGPRP